MEGEPEVRPPEKPHAEMFSMQDEEDEAEAAAAESGGRSSFARGSVTTGQRLSHMFEHNDLINNRMAALAEAIREGPLPLPRRLSEAAGNCCEAERGPAEEGGEEEEEEESEEEEEEDGAVGEAGLPPPPEGSRRALRARCLELERAVQELLAENATLRVRLREQPDVGATAGQLPLTAGGAEGPAATGSVAAASDGCTGAGVGAAAQTASSEVEAPPACAGDEQLAGETPAESSREPDPASRPEATSKAAYWRNARRKLKFERAQKSREQQAPQAKLRKAESIIERLVDEIEHLTVGSRVSPVAEAAASGAGVEAEQDAPGFVGDLKSAINGFFGGIGTAYSGSGKSKEEVAQEDSEQVAQRRRAQTEYVGGGGRTVVARPSEPFI